jgi:hypothetical protein
MNKFFRSSVAVVLFTAALAVFSSSCKKQFDQPPTEAPVTNVKANTTIAQLKARYTTRNTFVQILADTDIIIKGIVIGDDRSGNLYKTMVIQDASGGLQVLVDLNSYYNTYPIGREVFIKCNSLYLSDYGGVIQLGGGIETGTRPSLSDIPAARINTVIFKGTLNNVVVPKVVNVGQLGTDMQNKYISTLIKLEGFRFATADFGKTFASAGITSPSAASFDIYRCDDLTNSEIEIRTSNYSNFANVRIPDGIGPITAIYSIFAGSFSTTKQLTVRTPEEVAFTGTSCVIPPPTATLKEIGAIRALYAVGATTTVPDDTKITGIVISDRVGNNLNSQNIILQQATGKPGIVVRFGAAHNFNLGDSLTIVISGLGVSTFSNQLQVSTVPLSNATVVATGKSITPRTITISALNSEMAQPLSSPTHVECTLLKIVNATASGGSTFSGNRTLTDASGNITLRTGSTATFAATALPTGPKTWTVYPQFFNTTAQVFIRNLTDIQ